MAGKWSTPCENGHRVLTISWSQLRAYETCKQRVKLRREGRRAKLTDQRIFFPGTVTDRVVRAWLEESPGDLGRMPDMVSAIIDREEAVIREDEGGVMKWKSRDDRAKVLADCQEAVTKIEPSLMKYVVPFKYECDYRFRTKMRVPDPRGGFIEILLIGAMDILVHRLDKDRWAVFDVKHTRDNSYWRKTQGQLTFYDLDIELEYGQPTVITGLLQPLANPRVKPIKLDANLRAQMLQRITAMVRDIVLEELPPRTDNKHCGFCDVRHACAKFTPVINAKGKSTIAF